MRAGGIGICGFQLFQGYFFSEPRIISGHDLSTHFYSYYELLNELSKEQPNIKRVTFAQFVKQFIVRIEMSR